MGAAQSRRQVRRKAKTRIALYGFFAFSLSTPFFSGGAFRTPLQTLLMMSALVGFLWWKTYFWAQVLFTMRFYPDYVHALNRAQDGSTAGLATSLGFSKNRVRRDVRLLSRVGLLPQVLMSRTGDFTLTGQGGVGYVYLQQGLAYQEKARHETEHAQGPLSDKQQMLGVKCQGCGAQNRVARGHAVACPYCGSLVHLPEHLHP